MNFTIVLDREDDGRWIAEVEQIPGALAYGDTREEATARVEKLALRVVAGKMEADRTATDRINFAVA